MTNARSALVAIVGTLGGLAAGPTVTLRPDTVDIPIPPDQLLARFQTQFVSADDEIIANDGHPLVRRFFSRAGPFPYRTVEVVTYQSDAITFNPRPRMVRSPGRTHRIMATAQQPATWPRADAHGRSLTESVAQRNGTQRHLTS